MKDNVIGFQPPKLAKEDILANSEVTFDYGDFDPECNADI